MKKGGSGMFNKKRILITGAGNYGGGGFIGRNVIEQLSSKHEFILYHGDINEFDRSTIPTPYEIDCVVHLAARAGVRASWEDPQGYWNTNVIASKKVFDFCEFWKIRCLYASSSSVYEWWANPYATSKYAMEWIAPANSVGMRFHTVYGPFSRPDMFFDQMLNDKIDYITDHKRDWTHVNDVVDAIDILIRNDKVKGTVDIGTDDPISVKDVVDAYGYRDVPFKQVTGERQITHANVDKLKNLGWEPKHNILDECKKAKENRELYTR